MELADYKRKFLCDDCPAMFSETAAGGLGPKAYDHRLSTLITLENFAMHTFSAFVNKRAWINFQTIRIVDKGKVELYGCRAQTSNPSSQLTALQVRNQTMQYLKTFHAITHCICDIITKGDSRPTKDGNSAVPYVNRLAMAVFSIPEPYFDIDDNSHETSEQIQMALIVIGKYRSFYKKASLQLEAIMCNNEIGTKTGRALFGPFTDHCI